MKSKIYVSIEDITKFINDEKTNIHYIHNPKDETNLEGYVEYYPTLTINVKTVEGVTPLLFEYPNEKPSPYMEIITESLPVRTLDDLYEQCDFTLMKKMVVDYLNKVTELELGIELFKTDMEKVYGTKDDLFIKGNILHHQITCEIDPDCGNLIQELAEARPYLYSKELRRLYDLTRTEATSNIAYITIPNNI